VRLPPAAGVNVTEIVQLPPVATLLPQLLVWAKSPGFVPPITMLEIVNGPVPVLLRFTDCALVVVPRLVTANVKLLGDATATGTPSPVPLREAVCVVPATLPELSVTVNVAVRFPGAVGSNVMEIVQLPLAATVLPQVLVCPKSPALAPPMAMLAIVNGPVPEFVKLTVCAVAVTPTLVSVNATTVGDNAAVGSPAPVPVSETVCVDPDVPLALSVTVTVAVRVPVAVGLKVTEMVQLVLALRVAPQLLVSE
jgi:hypothetical protein